jgi:hydrogenase-4 component B
VISTTIILLWSVSALLATAVAAVALNRSPASTPAVYGATMLVSATAFVSALYALMGGGETSTVTLPLGLPWLGANFRIDALAAFFLVVVALGAPRRAFTVSATAATKLRRTACCPFSRPSSRA